MKTKSKPANPKSFHGQAAIESNCRSTADSLRGQAAIENLVMVGFALAFILPLAFFFMSSTGTENSKTTIAQAKVTVRTIADEAGELYLQGPGAKKTILVNYPDAVLGSSAAAGVVSLTVAPEPGRQVDIVAATFAPIRSSAIPDEAFAGRKNAGLQRIRIEVVSVDCPEGTNDCVEIGYEK